MQGRTPSIVMYSNLVECPVAFCPSFLLTYWHFCMGFSRRAHWALLTESGCLDLCIIYAATTLCVLRSLPNQESRSSPFPSLCLISQTSACISKGCTSQQAIASLLHGPSLTATAAGNRRSISVISGIMTNSNAPSVVIRQIRYQSAKRPGNGEVQLSVMWQHMWQLRPPQRRAEHC